MNNQANQIRGINQPGWDGLDAVPEMTISEDVEKETDVIFAQTFQTDAGVKALEYLRKVTIEQPAWIPGADPSFGYAREGQNSLVREIEQRIKRVRG